MRDNEPEFQNDSELDTWLIGRDNLSQYARGTDISIDDWFGCWVSLEHEVPVHESLEIGGRSFESELLEIDAYVEKALGTLGVERLPYWVDRDDAYDILETVGKPPKRTWPVYLMTVGEGSDERVVYVGKKSSKTARFALGHAAITKLHSPHYAGLKKTIHECQVMMKSDRDEYVPLQWIRPPDRARYWLTRIENSLIQSLQPELNNITVPDEFQVRLVDYFSQIDRTKWFEANVHRVDI